jgi:hypothetical protein
MPENVAGAAPLPHIPIGGWKDAAQYAFPKTNRNARERRTDYHAHAEGLLQQLAEALGAIPAPGADDRIPVAGLKRGVLVEVETMPPTPQAKATKIPAGLDFTAQQIAVLRSERGDDRTERAIVFVPDDARVFLTQRIGAYGEQNLGNRERPDVDKFEVVEAFRQASAASLVLGTADLASADGQWWELWLRRPDAIADAVTAAAHALNLDVHPDRLTFPDTIVVFVFAAAPALLQLVARLNGAISEVRPASRNIAPLLEVGEHGLGQHALVDDYLERITPPPEGAPTICILDTGVAAAHPLVAPALMGAWAVNDAWGPDDHAGASGHGTGMAGLVVHGDMSGPLSDKRLVALGHHIESVKFLPPAGFPATEPARYGFVTQSAVSVAEIERAGVVRSFCIATSSPDLDPDAPSSWSGAIDQICAGAMPGERQDNVAAKDHPKRLVLVATGNMAGGLKAEVEQHHSLEDPAQSWNALTIGGYTTKVELSATEPGLVPLAGANEKSPFSLGSQVLPPDLTPIKPEVMFEAGNMMVDGAGYCGWNPVVSLVTAGRDIGVEPLVPFWATSAATGVAGNFIGRLKASLPGKWPETYRALTVHSADWPQPIRSKLIGTGRSWRTITKGAKQKLLRDVGYGVPNLGRAVASARNDLTLLAEAEIQPYVSTPDGRAVFNEVHFYDLPWPRAALQALENASVILKVTLSYFIEPNLSGRAGTRPDTYRSFGLRFALKKRTETARDFRLRMSKSEEKAEKVGQEDDYWLIGPQAMQAGSLHCDLWRGPAVDLASHDEIAIFPVGGWWKSHTGQKRMNDKARYALAISISAPNLDVDLYAEITAEIEARIAAQVAVGAAPGGQ